MMRLEEEATAAPAPPLPPHLLLAGQVQEEGEGEGGGGGAWNEHVPWSTAGPEDLAVSKRKVEEEGEAVEKRRRVGGEVKNAVVTLNEYKAGLKYELVEDRGGRIELVLVVLVVLVVVVDCWWRRRTDVWWWWCCEEVCGADPPPRRSPRSCLRDGSHGQQPDLHRRGEVGAGQGGVGKWPCGPV